MTVNTAGREWKIMGSSVRGRGIAGGEGERLGSSGEMGILHGAPPWGPWRGQQGWGRAFTAPATASLGSARRKSPSQSSPSPNALGAPWAGRRCPSGGMRWS